MRVLMLCTDLRLGSERGEHAVRLATELGARGADVVVLSWDAADVGAAVSVQVHEYPPMIEGWERSRWAMQFSSAVLERATVAIATRGADIVHAHDWEVSWAARSAARLADAPLIATLHSTETIRTGCEYDDSTLIAEAERALSREASTVIVPSRALEAEVRAWSARVEVLDGEESCTARVLEVYERALERHVVRPRPAERIATAAREQLG